MFFDNFLQRQHFHCQFSQELAFREEERTRNMQVRFMDISICVHIHYTIYTASLVCMYHRIHHSLKTLVRILFSGCRHLNNHHVYFKVGFTLSFDLCWHMPINLKLRCLTLSAVVLIDLACNSLARIYCLITKFHLIVTSDNLFEYLIMINLTIAKPLTCHHLECSSFCCALRWNLFFTPKKKVPWGFSCLFVISVHDNVILVHSCMLTCMFLLFCFNAVFCRSKHQLPK